MKFKMSEKKKKCLMIINPAVAPHISIPMKGEKLLS